MCGIGKKNVQKEVDILKYVVGEVIELKNVTIDLGNIEIVEMVIKDWRHCEKLLEITLGAV